MIVSSVAGAPRLAPRETRGEPLAHLEQQPRVEAWEVRRMTSQAARLVRRWVATSQTEWKGLPRRLEEYLVVCIVHSQGQI